MRAIVAFLLALNLLVAPVGQAFAQNVRAAPPGVEPIPDYPGLYVADANRFMAEAFFVIMLSRPRTVRDFLSNVRTCSSRRAIAARLREEGLNTIVVPDAEVFEALRRGVCTIYVGSDFNFAQLDRRLTPDGRPPDDVRPPPGDVQDRDDDVNRDEERARDRTPPEIAPLQQVFEGQGRTVLVRARITDNESRIRSAFVGIAGGGQVQMSAPQGSSVYSATVSLPRDFDDRTAFIVATNTVGLSSRAVVTLRLLPWCGPREAVGRDLVRDVQDGLSCIGLSPGASDGALGPNTCRAIAGYLRGRMDAFNAGRLGWIALREEIERECLAAQPVVLDVPGPIARDAERTSVRIGLRQPGLTEAIRLTGPRLAPQIRAWRGQPLVFDLPMPPPGQEATFRVQALGPEGVTLASEALRLIRSPVELSVRPSGTVTVDDPVAAFTVTIPVGASAVARIEAQWPGGGPVVQPFGGGSTTLSVPSPRPGASQRVTFVAMDRNGTPLARQAVTMSRPEPPPPPQLSIESLDGEFVDAPSVRLRVSLENPGAAQRLVLRGGPTMREVADRSVGNGLWEIAQAMPPPGQFIFFAAQAVDRTGRVVVEDRLRIERAPVALQVRPGGRLEADTDSMTVQARVTSGADWITKIVARAAAGGPNGPVLHESRLVDGMAALQLDMPAPGRQLPVEIVAIGRNGEPHDPQELTLLRPAPVLPVTLDVSSPDGFSVDADATRVSVRVLNPADTAVIVVSDPGSGEVLARGGYGGTDWLGQVTMPGPGESRALVIEAQNEDGQTLALSQVMLVRPIAPGPGIPLWVWVAGLLLAGAGSGYLLGLLRGGGRHPESAEKPKTPPVRPTIRAEADRDPTIELDPTSPLSVVIRVDEDAAPQIEIEMPQDEGGST